MADRPLRRVLRAVRRLLVVVALVVVVVPGDAPSTRDLAAARRSPARTAPARDAVVVEGLRPLPAPAHWPEPYITPTTSTTTTTTTSPPPPAAALPPSAPEPAADPPRTDAAASAALAADPPAVVARVAQTVDAYASPDFGTPVMRITSTTEFGSPRVLLTTLAVAAGTEVSEEWIEVHLPSRPNGATGWIRTESVTLETVPDRITVDLDARTVTWERHGEVVGVVSAGVGAPRTPTPLGTYFVTDVLPYDQVGERSPFGEYGAWVVALDGFSDSVRLLDGRAPRLAIHGTDDPASIGAASSSGCVRLAAAPLDSLARNVALGTPVVVG